MASNPVLTHIASGAKASEIRYCEASLRDKPWDEIRFSWKASQTTTPSYKLTMYTFTGQASYMDDPTTSGVTEGFGLMFYQSRFYDPALGRFSSPDSIIPESQGTQAWDRYAFVNNNPLRYTDPTGHRNCEEDGYGCYGDDYISPPKKDRGRITQVDIDTYVAENQYLHGLVMGCGVLACSSAGGASIPQALQAAVANGYVDKWGIQPSGLVGTAKDLYGESNVQVHETWNLGEMYDALESGDSVIIDILVTDGNGYYPTSDSSNAFSHFARVLGIDFGKQEVYVENTLPGDSVWTVSFPEFRGAWMNPEIRAGRPPQGFPITSLERAVFWAVEITRP